MPELDLLVRGGTVVDGTRAPARTPPTSACATDGSSPVGRRRRRGGDETHRRRRVLVTPGFVDIHTHYDAQLHWEPTASPSSWHGVTTVITGNCGFSLFPARPDDVAWLLQMLSRVEGMSPDDAGGGVDVRGRRARATSPPGSTAASASTWACRSVTRAVRRYVHGRRRRSRGQRPTPRVAEMAGSSCATRIREGAVGFTSSQLEHARRPTTADRVPSNLAAPDELVALAVGARRFRPTASIEFITRTNLEGHDDADRELMLAMCAASGKPMNINPRATCRCWATGGSAGIGVRRRGARRRAPGAPAVAAQQMQVFFALHDTFLFDEMAAFRDVLTAGDRREALLRDPAVRDRMRRALRAHRGPRARLHAGTR